MSIQRKKSLPTAAHSAESVPLRDWELIFGYPRYPTLKTLLRDRRKNGFDACIFFLANKAFVNVEKARRFFESKLGGR